MDGQSPLVFSLAFPSSRLSPLSERLQQAISGSKDGTRILDSDIFREQGTLIWNGKIPFWDRKGNFVGNKGTHTSLVQNTLSSQPAK